MTRHVLEADRLTKTYGTTVALDGVSLRIDRGEAVGVMGPSGSGKTTLLHCLAGILAPDSGSVALHTARGTRLLHTTGSEGRAEVRRRHYGFVFQQGLLLPELTAAENVALPLLVDGVDRREAQDRAVRWLDRLGLAGLADRRPGQLSGGQAQRVAVARAQVTEPDVVFADEPTGALDSRTSGQVMDALLESTVGAGRTLVVVTHEASVGARCDRVLRLLDGRVTREDDATVEVTR